MKRSCLVATVVLVCLPASIGVYRQARSAPEARAPFHGAPIQAQQPRRDARGRGEGPRRPEDREAVVEGWRRTVEADLARAKAVRRSPDSAS
jgi:hypothetical protein